MSTNLHLNYHRSTSIAAISWTEIDNKADLEQWLLKRNKKHLEQVYDEERPLTREPLRSLLGESGTTDSLMKILDNDFNLDAGDYDPLIRTWLEWLVTSPSNNS
ncbi:hypothetical protein THAOC_07871, partial [Thalassiosira oceanica]